MATNAKSPGYGPGNVQEGFEFTPLVELVADVTNDAKVQLNAIKNRKSAISIADMFQMQMLMNHVSQMSEMSTAVVNAANSATVSMARNVKG